MENNLLIQKLNDIFVLTAEKKIPFVMESPNDNPKEENIYEFYFDEHKNPDIVLIINNVKDVNLFGLLSELYDEIIKL